MVYSETNKYLKVAEAADREVESLRRELSRERKEREREKTLLRRQIRQKEDELDVAKEQGRGLVKTRSSLQRAVSRISKLEASIRRDEVQREKEKQEYAEAKVRGCVDN